MLKQRVRGRLPPVIGFIESQSKLYLARFKQRSGVPVRVE